jgi:DinB superfamily
VNALGVLRDLFSRVETNVHGAVDGLDDAALAHRVGGDANSIAWLVWHLTRVQDDHVAEVAGTEQVWTAQGWAARFALPFDVEATGYGQGGDEVGAVRVGADLLLGYYDAVHEQTLQYLDRIGEDDLDTIVDRRWDPPVTLGVRLISVADDDIQHAGQAAFVRGVVESGG